MTPSTFPGLSVTRPIGLSAYAHALYEASYALNTQITYESSMRRFSVWCTARALSSLPAAPETVAEYMAALFNDGIRGTTIGTYLAGISHYHRDAGMVDPGHARIVQRVLRGAMRMRGTLVKQKTPAEVDQVTQILRVIPDTLVGKRDRAMITLGFAGAMRRSEIPALDVEDLEFTKDGVIVLIRRSKTDPLGAGTRIAVPTGPRLGVVTALQDWITSARILSGPIFRPIYNDHVIERRVSAVVGPRALKKYAAAAGLDHAQYSGHSLRSGFITEAANAGVDTLGLMSHSRHQTTRQLKAYVRKANLFKRHPGQSFL